MKPITLLILVFFISCAPHTGTLTQAQVEQDTINTAHEPMPVLHAYRKKPGEPKTVQVQGYYKKDSTYIQPHARSARTSKVSQ